MGLPPEEIQDAPPGSIDISKIDRKHLTRIRALFSTEKITEDNLEEAWDHPTILDDRHVVIVDEVLQSGSTLKIARLLMSHAIPNADFSGVYWSKPGMIPLGGGVRDSHGRMQYTREWVPVWYHEDRASGRGIGDRDSRYPEKAEEAGVAVSEKSRVGRFVLSTPTHNLDTYGREVDTESLRIREDIDRLDKDILERRILYRPSPERDFEDFKKRVETINGIGFEEWKEKRDRLVPKMP